VDVEAEVEGQGLAAFAPHFWGEEGYLLGVPVCHALSSRAVSAHPWKRRVGIIETARAAVRKIRIEVRRSIGECPTMIS
jgi:hypothetical protein